MKRFSVLALMVVSCLAVQAHGGVIYESAELRDVGYFGGNVVASNQWLGSRFTLTEATEVTAVGGSIAVWESGSLFAAVVGVNGAFPDFQPANIASEALAYTTFAPLGPSSGGDRFTPLSVTLGPGEYALIFGSGKFGTTGSGWMSADNAVTDAGLNSFFTRNSSGNWSSVGVAPGYGWRFVVEGTAVAVPEPSTLAASLTGMALVGLTLVRRRRAV